MLYYALVCYLIWRKQYDIKRERTESIEALRTFESEDEPYYLCYSGGKDSDVIRILAQLAGVKHEIHHNLTTVDAPETIQYIKTIPNVQIDKARWKKMCRRSKRKWRHSEIYLLFFFCL